MRWILDYRGVELMCAADHRHTLIPGPQTHFHVHTCRSAWCEAKAGGETRGAHTQGFPHSPLHAGRSSKVDSLRLPCSGPMPIGSYIGRSCPIVPPLQEVVFPRPSISALESAYHLWMIARLLAWPTSSCDRSLYASSSMEAQSRQGFDATTSASGASTFHSKRCNFSSKSFRGQT